VLVLNKSDLPAAVSDAEAPALWPGVPHVHTSALAPDGTRDLEDLIVSLALGGSVQLSDALVSTARHRDALRRAREHLIAARATLAEGLPLDFVSIDLRSALEALGEITGETATADLLDAIFAEFCIGK
jgi:tRNA modification GTPase